MHDKDIHTYVSAVSRCCDNAGAGHWPSIRRSGGPLHTAPGAGTPGPCGSGMRSGRVTVSSVSAKMRPTKDCRGDGQL